MDRMLSDEEATALVGAEYLEDLTALNLGKISYAEFERRRYKRQQKAFTPKLLEYRQSGNWDQFIALALTVYEVMPIAFKHFSDVPDNLKYDFAIEAYTHHGDSIPAVRKAVRSALKYGKPDLPPEIAEQDEITVYRAGEEPIQKAKYRISWTADLNTALFFMDTWRSRHAEHLYTAKIQTSRIIAYTDIRNEHEVMQYNSVYDIHEITK